jgi:hypothetical protein
LGREAPELVITYKLDAAPYNFNLSPFYLEREASEDVNPILGGRENLRLWVQFHARSGVISQGPLSTLVASDWADLRDPKFGLVSFYLFAADPQNTNYPRRGLRIGLRG